MSSRNRHDMDNDWHDRHRDREPRRYDEHDERYYSGSSSSRRRSRSRDRHHRSRSGDKRSRSGDKRSKSRERDRRSRSRDRHERRRSRSKESRRQHRSHRSSSSAKNGERRQESDEQKLHQIENDSKIQAKLDALASAESTLDGSESGSNENTHYIGGVESEEERKRIHEQMQERLRLLKEQEPKRIQHTKASSSKMTPFANDGSFLEMFKQMQQRFEQETEQEQKDQERLKLPMFGRRRGGKILKTGIVEKPKKIEENPADGPKDAWSLYLQEVKRYKNATCDPDAPSRSLVK